MTIQLHEITPTLIEQLWEQSEEDRLRALTSCGGANFVRALEAGEA
jgi:hypothetical protein